MLDVVSGNAWVNGIGVQVTTAPDAVAKAIQELEAGAA
jgi:hypothetical protein